MNKPVHQIYIYCMILIVLMFFFYLSWVGFDYYQTSLEERFYHPRHHWFKPSGVLGHGLGIIGTLLIIFGVSIYIARKRYNFLQRHIRLKYLLEFHIFLCTLGPLMVLFHTAFKFGGIVSIAFWSMIAIVLSGVIGRFIYIQIPRTIEGRELSLMEIQNVRDDLFNSLQARVQIDDNILNMIKLSNSQEKISFLKRYIKNQRVSFRVKSYLKMTEVVKKDQKRILNWVKKEISLGDKIRRLQSMQKLFKYWHVIHMPFAFIMLIIVIIHVGITLTFGYKWIF